MSLQMLSSWLLLAWTSHCDYYQRCVCSESHNTGAHMLNVGLHTPPGNFKSRLNSRLTFYDLVIFIWQCQIATTETINPSPHGSEWNSDSHTGEIWASITQQLLGKSPESLSPASCSFPRSLKKPPLNLSLYFSVALCWGELLFFHLKDCTRKEGKCHPTPGLSHSSIFNSIALHFSLCVCRGLPSTSTIACPLPPPP